jgi:PPM family protein phosphatase
MVAGSRRLHFGAESIVGRVREHNEDAFIIDETLAFAVVCDGMGGHANGEVASRLAAETILEELRSNTTAPADASVAGEVLAAAVQRANSEVLAAGGPVHAQRRMGTTVVALWCVCDHAIISHVGDSRCYLLRSESLRRLTADHTFLEDARRHELGMEVNDDMAKHFAHVLTRSVGQAPACMIDVAMLPLADNDRFLLCSDGLSGMLDDHTIAAILLGTPTAELAATRLVDAANQRGGIDNITAVTVWTSG